MWLDGGAGRRRIQISADGPEVPAGPRGVWNLWGSHFHRTQRMLTWAVVLRSPSKVPVTSCSRAGRRL